MSSKLSGQINDCASSKDFSMKKNNFPDENNNKPSSDSSSNKIFSNSHNVNILNSVETIKTTVSISEVKELLQAVLKIILPQEKLTKYEKFDNYLEESAKNEIFKDIEDIANEIKNLKDKEEKELSRQKNMESIKLDIDSKYTNLNNAIKEMSEMMKQYQERNNELLSKVSESQEIIINLKAEINYLNQYIKEKINNSIKNTKPITSEEGFFKTGFPPLKTSKNNNELPSLNIVNSPRNVIKKRNQIYSIPKKDLIQKTDKISNNNKYKSRIKNNLVKGPKSKSKSKSPNKNKILSNNNSKENINSIYIINLRNQNKFKNNVNKKI